MGTAIMPALRQPKKAIIKSREGGYTSSILRTKEKMFHYVFLLSSEMYQSEVVLASTGIADLSPLFILLSGDLKYSAKFEL